jgi:hypothetical protein
MWISAWEGDCEEILTAHGPLRRCPIIEERRLYRSMENVVPSSVTSLFELVSHDFMSNLRGTHADASKEKNRQAGAHFITLDRAGAGDRFIVVSVFHHRTNQSAGAQEPGATATFGRAMMVYFI